MYGVQERIGSLHAGLADVAQKLSAPLAPILTVWVDDQDNIYRDLPPGMIVPRHWMVGRYVAGTASARYEKDLTLFRCARAAAQRAVGIDGPCVQSSEASVDASTASCYTVACVRQRWEVRFPYHREAPRFVHFGDALDSARRMAEARWEIFSLPSAVEVIDAEYRRRDDIAFGIWLSRIGSAQPITEHAHDVFATQATCNG